MADRTFHKRFTLTARIGVVVFAPGCLFLLGQAGYHRHLCGYHHCGHDRAHTEYNLYLQDGKTYRPG